MDKSHIYNIDGLTDALIIEMLKSIVDHSSGCGAMRIVKASANCKLKDAVVRMTSFLDENGLESMNLQTRVYMLVSGMHHIEDCPKCECCGKTMQLNVASVHLGFIHKHCSAACAARDPKRLEKIEQTNLERHGKRKWSNGKKISEALKNLGPERRMQATEKFKMTRLKRIDLNPDYWKDRHAKSLQTKKEKYGDENFNNHEKASSTKRERLAEDPLYFKRQQQQAYETKVEKYGIGNVSNTAKAKQTKKEKYGDENFNNQDKARRTCIDRYGVENAALLDSSKQAAAQTCLERYGASCYLASDAGRQASQQTCQLKYGAPNFMSSEQGKQLVSRWHALQTWKRVNSSLSEVLPLFSLEDIERKTPLTQFKWRCKLCGNEFYGPINFVQARDGGQFALCLNCHPMLKGKSKKQLDVLKFLRCASSDVFTSEDRKQIFPYEIDIYDASQRIGVEFDGIYWHSAYGGGTDGHLAFKTDLCNQLGIELVHVFEDEWECRRQQCKAKLKQVFKIDETVAVGTEVRQASTVLMELFLAANSHDIFSKPALHNFALVDRRGKALSMMALSVFERKALVSEFCNSKSSNTSNSFKLFIDFIVNSFSRCHAVEAVQFNMDNRWPCKKMLEECGFLMLKVTRPSRWLVDWSKGWTRQQRGASLQLLLSLNLDCNSSAESMAKLKLTYIEDCGKSVYMKRL